MAVDVPRSGRRTPCWRMCGVGETRELDSESEGYLPQVEWERDFLGGGNSDSFCYFHPEKWGKMKPFWRAYFSDGLKPPTSCCVCNIFVYIDRIWYNQVWNYKVSFKIFLKTIAGELVSGETHETRELLISFPSYWPGLLHDIWFSRG